MSKTVMPVVDTEKCRGCGLCSSVCSCGALVVIENVVTVIETEACGWCTQCEAVCPNQAISCGYLVIIEER
ncbi:MAG: 4Fe-4S binding protein [Chloroflexota bacterium]|nr:4Fe-4S binding protein [Chloroflexota bacterium]